MRSDRVGWRAGRTLGLATGVALSAMVLTASPAAAQAPPAQGIQFGQPIDLATCNRNAPMSLFLNNTALLARTSWVRLDLRAAGGSDVTICADVAAAYQGILDELSQKAPQIRVIGLLSNEFVYGAGLDVARFVAAAGTVACSPAYAQVDVWEIWNEPTQPATLLSAQDFARLLGLSSRQIRDCGGGDLVISGGITPNDPVPYLETVSTEIGANGYGGYADLAGAVDGIGAHPYVGAIADGEAGHAPLNAFLNDLYAPFSLPIYITEFGWAVNGTFNEPSQCHNLVNAFALINTQWAPSGIVPAATWFTLHDFYDPNQHFGLYDDDTFPRPALTGYLADRCPPMGPANPTATPLTATSVRITWTDNSTNETGFEIYNGVSYASVGANVTSYTWTGIAPGTYMCFAVHAYNGDGNSPDTPYACTVTPTVPATPTNPTATPLDATRIQVTWTDNSSDETGFAVSNGVTTVDRPANTTQYTWAGLAPGTYMCFQVRADSAAGSSPWSTQACATTPTVPAAPTGQAATAASGTSIRVSWTDRSTNEAGFQINNGVVTVTVGANVTSYTWTGLANGTYMCFQVRAYNLAGASAYTPWACATTPTVPIAPTGQTATPDSGTSIRVGWTDRSNNESGFEIWNGVTSRYVAANATSYTWTGLANGTYMCFTIRAYNLAGPSAPTPWACTTTPTIPAAPTGQTAVPVNDTSIRVGWTDQSYNETGFEIWNGVTSRYVAANTASYTWTGLAPGTYMCFTIRAYNLAGPSAPTPWACTTTPAPPAAPSNQAATPISTSQIRVTWRDNSTNETGFQIYDGVNYFTVGANVTTFTRTGLGSRTYMCFAIRAYNAYGYSGWTPYACTYTL